MVLANGNYNGQRIVDPDALLPALTPQIVSNPPSRAGDALRLLRLRLQRRHHVGGPGAVEPFGCFDLGAATNFVIIPSADVAIVALTNAAPSGIPETLTAEFADLVQFGEVREDWRKLYSDAFAGMDQPVGALAGKTPPANPAPAKPLAAYIGTYPTTTGGRPPSPRRTASSRCRWARARTPTS